MIDGIISGIVGVLTIASGIVTTLRGWRLVRAELETLRHAFMGEIAALRREIADMRAQLSAVSSELRGETGSLRERMARAEARLEQLEAKQ